MSKVYENHAAAKRYNAARALPEKTSALWMDSLRSALPPDLVPRAVLDLGAGTGRFAPALQSTFQCPVIAVEPSGAMLEEGTSRGFPGVVWQRGSAESIPADTASTDLVWMSQVFHHLEDRSLALREISRVLRPAGCLAIRNGTKENDAEIEWSSCFPEAKAIGDATVPSQKEVLTLVSHHGFRPVVTTTVYQYFAASYAEYYTKISQRGLSSLIAISDEAFEAGLRRLERWVAEQPADKAVFEPVDLFVFRVEK